MLDDVHKLCRKGENPEGPNTDEQVIHQRRQWGRGDRKFCAKYPHITMACFCQSYLGHLLQLITGFIFNKLLIPLCFLQCPSRGAGWGESAIPGFPSAISIQSVSGSQLPLQVGSQETEDRDHGKRKASFPLPAGKEHICVVKPWLSCVSAHLSPGTPTQSDRLKLQPGISHQKTSTDVLPSVLESLFGLLTL